MKINIFDNGRKIYIKKGECHMEDIDMDFWENLDTARDIDNGLKEAIEEYVRDCVDLYEWLD